MSFKFFVFALFFLVIILDLNEFVSSLNNASGEGLMSGIILLSTIVLFSDLLYRYGYKQTFEHRVFTIFLLVYTSLGVISGFIFNTDYSNGLRRLLPGFLIYFLSQLFFVTLTEKKYNFFIFYFLQIIFCISSGAILYSYFFEVDLIINESTYIERATGFYTNPNRAGNISVIAQIFTLFILFNKNVKSNYLAIFIYILHFIAALLTFSKTAFLLSLLSIAFLIYFSRKEIIRDFKTQIAFLILFIGLFLVSKEFFYANENISRHQSKILLQFSQILSGEINDKTTTGRNNLAENGFALIKQRPFSGYGLSTFTSSDSIEGQPIHNMYLGLWGEAGIIALIFYIVYLFVILFNKFDLLKFNVYKILIILIVIISFSSHDILTFKPFMVFLGLINARVARV